MESQVLWNSNLGPNPLLTKPFEPGKPVQCQDKISTSSINLHAAQPLKEHSVLLSQTHYPLATCAGSRNLAVCSVGPGANLARFSAARVASVPVAGLAAVLAAVSHGTCVTIIGVDATENTTTVGNHVVHDDVPRSAIVGAVATAASDLAIVVGVKVLDLHCASTVELDNLVRGVESTTSVDVRSSACLLQRTKGND